MINQTMLENSKCEVVLTDKTISENVILSRKWQNNCCKLTLKNNSNVSQKVKEVVLFQLAMPYGEESGFYGEAYNMLSQYKGSVSKFENITCLSDYGHYKLPQEDGFFTVYNMVTFFENNDTNKTQLLAFSSCHRFSGEFRFNRDELKIVMDIENLEIAAGEELVLEEFMANYGEREELLTQLGTQIGLNHRRLSYPKAPNGWCSWYCYGPNVTEQDIFDNLAAIKKDFPEMKFIQLDDGYQNKMGDWLVPHPNFPNGIKELCLQIKEAGFEPAIWVAPFIAETDSELFKNHPDWFIKDENGKPLASNEVTFGGWRFAPWYMLDGTHPEAQNYLRETFRVMREEWQCTYFKLDANMWGAMPFGERYDKNATKIDAYRAGMQTVIEGAGADGFILGCNAPMWPSIGVVHGMRTTGDILRRWETFKMLSYECFWRNWQNGHLWYNDPDCIVLKNLENKAMGPDGKEFKTKTLISEEEFSFHKAHMLASGGMMLSSDKIMELESRDIAVLQKLLASSGIAAKFDDTSFRIGRIELEDGVIICLFNYNETTAKYVVDLHKSCDVSDYWTNEEMAKNISITAPINMAGRSGKVLWCKYR